MDDAIFCVKLYNNECEIKRRKNKSVCCCFFPVVQHVVRGPQQEPLSLSVIRPRKQVVSSVEVKFCCYFGVKGDFGFISVRSLDFHMCRLTDSCQRE